MGKFKKLLRKTQYYGYQTNTNDAPDHLFINTARISSAAAHKSGTGPSQITIYGYNNINDIIHNTNHTNKGIGMLDCPRDNLTAHYFEQRRALLRFLVVRMRNPDIAEDVMQDLYIKLAKANLPERIDNPSGFLFRMAANLALDHIRKNERVRIRDRAWSDLNREKVGNEYLAEAPHADDALIAKERLAALKVRLQSLSPKAREAFERHKFRGQSYKQVAQEMGVSIGTVGKHLGKAIKHIMQTDMESEHEK
ncbi:MAG: hypothetical protein COA91_00275 [Robiginitomaculum sp.]|nr:MAG: hypothetical protein COA91_00275 [Robiginitomaculum sp.]